MAKASSTIIIVTLDSDEHIESIMRKIKYYAPDIHKCYPIKNTSFSIAKWPQMTTVSLWSNWKRASRKRKINLS